MLKMYKSTKINLVSILDFSIFILDFSIFIIIISITVRVVCSVL